MLLKHYKLVHYFWKIFHPLKVKTCVPTPGYILNRRCVEFIKNMHKDIYQIAIWTRTKLEITTCLLEVDNDVII